MLWDLSTVLLGARRCDVKHKVEIVDAALVCACHLRAVLRLIA